MNKQTQEALKMAIEALEFIKDGGFYTGEDDCIEACKKALEQPAQEVKCNSHPDAPHGFMRDESHSQDRYVCECEYWTPPAQEPAPPCQECENLKHDLEGYMEANKALINREWQYLSYVEVNNILDNHRQQAIGGVDWLERFAYAIQQASKEKNT